MSTHLSALAPIDTQVPWQFQAGAGNRSVREHGIYSVSIGKVPLRCVMLTGGRVPLSGGKVMLKSLKGYPMIVLSEQEPVGRAARAQLSEHDINPDIRAAAQNRSWPAIWQGGVWNLPCLMASPPVGPRNWRVMSVSFPCTARPRSISRLSRRTLRTSRTRPDSLWSFAQKR